MKMWTPCYQEVEKLKYNFDFAASFLPAIFIFRFQTEPIWWNVT